MFVGNGIVYVTMSHQCDQLLGSVFLHLFYIDGIGDFVGQVVDAQDGRRTFHNVQRPPCQIELAADKHGRVGHQVGTALNQYLSAEQDGRGEQQRIFQFAGNQHAGGNHVERS